MVSLDRVGSLDNARALKMVEDREVYDKRNRF